MLKSMFSALAVTALLASGAAFAADQTATATTAPVPQKSVTAASSVAAPSTSVAGQTASVKKATPVTKVKAVKHSSASSTDPVKTK